MRHLLRSLAAPALALSPLLLGACASAPSSLAPDQSAVLIDTEGVALSGYDPVAYFTEDAAVPGDAAWAASHQGATYTFASEANRDAFVDEPERYVPAYGGWCAWAMADGEGSLVEVDPRSFLIQDGRLLLFFDGFLADTRAMWLDGDARRLAVAADGNWRRIRRRS